MYTYILKEKNLDRLLYIHRATIPYNPVGRDLPNWGVTYVPSWYTPLTMDGIWLTDFHFNTLEKALAFVMGKRKVRTTKARYLVAVDPTTEKRYAVKAKDIKHTVGLREELVSLNKHGSFKVNFKFGDFQVFKPRNAEVMSRADFKFMFFSSHLLPQR